MKTKTIKSIPTFQDPVIYTVIITKAYEFSESLSGDIAYEDKEIQRVALENRIVGWMSTTAWFAEYRDYLEKNFARDDIWTHATDAALQAASDVLH